MNKILFFVFLFMTLFSFAGEVPSSGEFSGCVLQSEINWAYLSLYLALTILFGVKYFNEK